MKCFLKTSKGSCGELGEKRLISKITEIMRSYGVAEASPRGPGDDCAAISSKAFGKNMLCTSDAVILGVHFSEEDNPRSAGKKLLKRNVSDIAAMGGKPLYALSSAIISKNLSSRWLEEFCEGLCESAKEYGVKFCGGDLARVDGKFFSMHLSLLGACNGRIMTRSGAKEGDVIYVTSRLGGSFETGKHLHFIPRLKEAEFLSNTSGVCACMDISDGVASDLKHLIPHGCRAVLDRVPQTVINGKEVGLRKALCDGEDYELLFAYSGSSDKLEKSYKRKFGCELYKIGRFEKAAKKSDAGKIFIQTNSGIKEFLGSGFEH